MQLLRCSIPHCGLLPLEDDLFFALPCYLPACHMLLDSRLLGLTLRPSASVFPVFRCHRVLGHARGWHLRRKPCVFPLVFLLDFSVPVDVCKVIQAAIEKFLFMRCGNVMALQIREIVFGCLPHSRCVHRTRPLILGTLECAQKSRRLVALCLVTLFGEYESTNFLKIVSLCNVCLCTNVVFPSAICICWSAHCPMTGWVCQWKPFWIPVDDSFKKAFLEDWVFQITDPFDICLTGGQGDTIPETPEVSLPVSSSQREAPKPEVSACG